ncbi:MAG: peptidoglycan-binding domain-containing protein [Fidelibacterota bacterium]
MRNKLNTKSIWTVFAVLCICTVILYPLNLTQSSNDEEYSPQESYDEIEWHNRYTGEEKLLLKNILFHLGYEIETDTSLWTAKNSEVVRKFQQDNLIKIDGKIGPETLSTMSLALQVLYRHESETASNELAQPLHGKILFRNTDKVHEGDIVKYWHYDFDKWLYSRVIKIVGTEVTLHDWRRDEIFVMDMDNIEGY